MNAAEQPQRYRVQVTGLPGIALSEGIDVQLAAAEARWVTVSAQIPFESGQAAGPGAHPIHFEIERVADVADRVVRLSEKSTFVVPR